MTGKPFGKAPMTKNEYQRRWRAKVRRRLLITGDCAGLRTPKPRPGDNEFWPTPPCLRAALCGWVLPHVPEGTVWECGAGDGRLGDDIAATGRRVIMTDIDPQRLGIGRHDFHDPPPPATAGAITITNVPWSEERLDPFIARNLELLDSGHLRAVVLLFRADHTGTAGRTAWLNRAAMIWTCCWRPRWVPGTTGSGRWWCVWVVWLADYRGPPVTRFLEPDELRAAGVWPVTTRKPRERSTARAA